MISQTATMLMEHYTTNTSGASNPDEPGNPNVSIFSAHREQRGYSRTLSIMGEYSQLYAH